MQALSFQGLLSLVVSYAFILGLIIGSFINVVFHRLPVMLSRQWTAAARTELGLPPAAEVPRLNLSVPRSCCPACNHPIAVWENIPVLSYLALRGKCSSCRTPISIRYPLVELVTGILFAIVAWRFGLTVQTAGLLALTGLLMSISLIDSKHQLIPDCLVQPLLWIGLVLNSTGVFATLDEALWGTVIGYAGLWSISAVFTRLSGKQAMGHGDFKLLAALGAWCGWQLVPVILYGACLLGCAFFALQALNPGSNSNGASRMMPFGPCLGVMGWITLMWGHFVREVATTLLN
ncbi:A24 family peptidase [Pseudomonas syringae]|uniref:prepilin peptidase n=1 Tax=Pseudomonas syringae TaxID=317 RepID=UPI00234C6B56|nr:A24 family peptidase [Pseudomonas syringae]MDC6536567.1 A24 family peptidase [Pseudomonas syringae]